MKDPWFERTVVLLCQYEAQGAIGLVINRDGPVSLGVVAEKMSLAAPRLPDAPTWWGGPVETGAGFVLWRGRVPQNEGWTISEQIAVSPSSTWLARLIEHGDVFHLCLGYSGWGPSQLDREIRTGSWLYSEADPDLVFDTPVEERYDLALRRLGVSPSRLWMQPVDE